MDKFFDYIFRAIGTVLVGTGAKAMAIPPEMIMGFIILLALIYIIYVIFSDKEEKIEKIVGTLLVAAGVVLNAVA